MDAVEFIVMFLAGQAWWLFYVVALVALVLAGYEAWTTRSWLKAFDSKHMNVKFKGPKGKLCHTLKGKLQTIEDHKGGMMLKVAGNAVKLIVLGAVVPSLLLGLFVYFHDRLDIADGSFVRSGSLETVESPTFDETAAFVSSQVLMSGFDFAELYGVETPPIDFDRANWLSPAVIVVLIFRTFVQVFAVGIPWFILYALYLMLTRTSQERDLRSRMDDANCN